MLAKSPVPVVPVVPLISSSNVDVEFVIGWITKHGGSVNVGAIGPPFKARTGLSFGPWVKDQSKHFVLRKTGSSTFVAVKSLPAKFTTSAALSVGSATGAPIATATSGITPATASLVNKPVPMAKATPVIVSSSVPVGTIRSSATPTTTTTTGGGQITPATTSFAPVLARGNHWSATPNKATRLPLSQWPALGGSESEEETPVTSVKNEGKKPIEQRHRPLPPSQQAKVDLAAMSDVDASAIADALATAIAVEGGSMSSSALGPVYRRHAKQDIVYGGLKYIVQKYPNRFLFERVGRDGQFNVSLNNKGDSSHKGQIASMSSSSPPVSDLKDAISEITALLSSAPNQTSQGSVLGTESKIRTGQPLPRPLTEIISLAPHQFTSAGSDPVAAASIPKVAPTLVPLASTSISAPVVTSSVSSVVALPTPIVVEPISTGSTIGMGIDLEKRLVNVLSMQHSLPTRVLGEFYRDTYRSSFPAAFILLPAVSVFSVPFAFVCVVGLS
jgi:hypothetical protein